MKNDRSTNQSTGENVALAGNAWTRFWFTPIAPTGLHCLRVLSGLLFFFWLLSFLGHQHAFFSLNGWLDRAGLIEAQRQQNMAPAPIGWSILYLAGTDADAFQALYIGSLVVLALFTLGVATRLTGIGAWVVVVSFLANPATSYDGDYLLGILAFYLMLAYVLLGQWNSPLATWERILGSRHDFLFGGWLFAGSSEARPVSYAANLVMRLLQIHLALILVTSGLHKFQMSDWWTGVAYWYPLHPPYQTTVESLKQEMPRAIETLFVLSLVQYIAVAWQICFPLFAWRTGIWRVLLLGGALAYWLGHVLVFKLPLFGEFVFLGSLSFLGPDDWAWMQQRLRSFWGSAPASPSKAESAKAPMLAGTEHIKR